MVLLRETLPIQPGDWESLSQYLAQTQRVVNASDPLYGAKGDGVTDDTVAIQAAITAAGANIVVLGVGTYVLTAQLTFATAGCRLVGAGQTLTTLKRSGSYGTVIGVSADNVELQDFTIDGGLASFPTNANHGISVQNSNHFRARRITVTNHLNTAILCQGTPNSTYRDNIIEGCLVEGLGTANNGFLIGALDESGIRGSIARNVQGGAGPGYGIQLKNGCRFSFITDCTAINCTGGITFGRDSTPGVSASRITGCVSYGCDGGLLLGDANNNVVTGVTIYQTTNVNDAVRFQNGCTNNVVTGVTIHGTGAGRSAVRFDDTSTDNTVTLDLVDAACAATATFTVSADRNLVLVKKYGTSTPGHDVSSSSTGVANRVRRVEDRLSLFETAKGCVAESFDRQLPTAALAMTSQQPYYIPVYLFAGEVVTNVTLHVSALTVAPTNFFVGLYNAAGVQKAVSADLAASVTTTGQKTLAFTGAFTVLDSGVYYIALLNNGGTLSPLGLAGSTASRLGSNPFPYAQDTSAVATTLPSPNLSLAAGTKALWVQLS